MMGPTYVLPFRWRSALSNCLTAATSALGVLAGIVTIPIGCIAGTDRVLRRGDQWSARVYLRADPDEHDPGIDRRVLVALGPVHPGK